MAVRNARLGSAHSNKSNLHRFSSNLTNLLIPHATKGFIAEDLSVFKFTH